MAEVHFALKSIGLELTKQWAREWEALMVHEYSALESARRQMGEWRSFIAATQGITPTIGARPEENPKVSDRAGPSLVCP